MSQIPSANSTQKVTVPRVKQTKASAGATPLVMLTAYDYPTAKILEEAGVDLILVGDSLGTVVYGEPNTLSVTMEQMLMHTRAVSRAAVRAMVVADMPFLSYQISKEQAVQNAGRFLKESGAHAVKLEGGAEMAETISAITRAGIPVCAHIGLTPQSIQALGTYRMHGKTPSERDYLLQSALAVADAGAFAVVLECIEPALAREISENISIPTIGIGSGQGCDGQVLVFHDLVGLTAGHVPRFVNPTCQVAPVIAQGVRAYVERTRQRGVTHSLAPQAIDSAPVTEFSGDSEDKNSGESDNALSH